MVKTTTGPAEKSTTGSKAAAKAPGDVERLPRHDDLDDATWDRITSMARSQGTDAATVVRRAIESAYGVDPAEGAYHSGMDTDPAQTG